MSRICNYLLYYPLKLEGWGWLFSLSSGFLIGYVIMQGCVYSMRRKDVNNFRTFITPVINKETMVRSSTDDFSEQIVQLVTENTQLKEALDAVKKKNEAIEGEIKSLQKKLIRLLEEKVNRLEGELRDVLRIDDIDKA